MSFKSGPSMSTGSVGFDTNMQTQGESIKQNVVKHSAVMHVALLGDFTARENKKLCDVESIAKRKPIDIDRDNFEEIFSELNITLDLPALNERISFSEFDDLHPDFLFEKLALFERFRTLKRRLKNPSLFDAAAAEVRGWANDSVLSSDESNDQRSDTSASHNETKNTGGLTLDKGMLDHIFSSTVSEQTEQSSASTAERLIKDIVASFIEPKAHSELPALLQAIDDACSETMRKVLHSSAFQSIESSWRSVYNLVRRTDTNSRLKLFLFDISQGEVQADIERAFSDVSATQLHKLLVESGEIPGATPFSVICADYIIENTLSDLSVAHVLAHCAWANNASALVGANPKIANCAAIEVSVDPDDWQYQLSDEFKRAWQSLRESEQAAHISLVAPRTLLRLPYGKKTSPIESFDFEELSQSNAHRFYCWGNSSFSVTCLVAESFSRYQWAFKLGQIQEIENLPLHAFTDDGGDEQVKSCAEALLTDSGVKHMNTNGLLAVRSVRGKASVVVWNFCSISDENSSLKGPWSI